jgi:hypothetical protein
MRIPDFHLLRSTFLLGVGVAVCCACVAGPLRAGGRVTISFSIPESTVSLHEPVYIQFSIHNGLSEAVRFDLGYDGKHNFEFTVIEPDGSVVRTLPTKMGGEVMGRWVDRAPLAPGKTFTKTLLLNQWYDFRAPGNYVVEAKLGGLVQTLLGSPVQSSPTQEIFLQVTPRNPERLQALCEELAKKAMGDNAEAASNAAFALSYVNDPVAVPYLGRLLKESVFGGQSAIAGLVRIGNAEAVRVLKSNLNTQDAELRIQIQNALAEINRSHRPGVTR